MQARAGAVDELLASGALNDLSGTSDPLQAELDKTSRANQVELELAQLKGALPAGASGALPAAPASGGTAEGSAQPAEAGAEEEPAEGVAVPPAAPPAPANDLFSLDSGSGS